MLENKLRIVTFLTVPAICFYVIKKKDQRNYSWKDFVLIIPFSYLWSFFNLFVHECGHAFTHLAFGDRVKQINVGVGKRLLEFSVNGTKIVFNILPYAGSCSASKIYLSSMATRKESVEEIICLAMGTITQFFFLYLIHWLLKRSNKWQKNIIGYFCYKYAIKVAFWLTFIVNFPYFSPRNDWTRITRSLIELYKTKK